MVRVAGVRILGMRSVLLCSVCLVLSVMGRSGECAPVKGPFTGQGRVAPNRATTVVETFKGGERACVVVTGDGSSYLGLYVYDADGNCIARDDAGDYRTRDDLAVEWFPQRDSRFAIEVRNLGGTTNTYSIAVR
jgi:hypothetical protein